MVLSDRTIKEELAKGRLVIDPLDPDDIQPASVDVHIDRRFRVFKVSSRPYIDVREPMDDLTDEVVIEDERPFFIHPGEFVLASTLEVVTLPDDILAQVEGKIVARPHRPADPRHRRLRRPRLARQLTLELSNVAKMPIALHYGMKIGQLSFMRMSHARRPPLRQRRPAQQVPGPDDARPPAAPSPSSTAPDAPK